MLPWSMLLIGALVVSRTRTVTVVLVNDGPYAVHVDNCSIDGVTIRSGIGQYLNRRDRTVALSRICQP